MISETRETLAETKLDAILASLEHLTEDVHAISQFIDENRVVLEKAQKLMKNPVTDYLRTRPRKAAAHG